MSYVVPCPHCGKPMSKRLRSKLAPPVPPHFGPFRRDAISSSQEGWCAVCDELPIPGWRKGLRRFTCGRKACKQHWGYLATLDARRRKVEATSSAA